MALPIQPGDHRHMRRDVRLPSLTILVFAIVLALAWFAYMPGLHGGFLFDDYANLPAIGATGPVDNWATFFRYVTSGEADPTGRPLALLSFLVDARDWPANPYPFKRTNLLLHLTNAALLFVFLRRLGRLGAGSTSRDPGPSRRLELAAALASALWVLHPLFVSTTLYIVQREAMLPATCALLGLNTWLSGRARMVQGNTLAGGLLVATGLLGCTALGVLSKANGALLPVFALLVEYIVLSPRRDLRQAQPAAYRWTMVVCAWLPAVAIIGYLAWQGWVGMVRGIGTLRPWTLGERLLTEPRILFDYLRLLWVPRPFTSGVFNEQFMASKSLTDPSTTWIAILGLLVLIFAAVGLRRRWPAASLAIAFFLCAHLVESSTIALELYYEHRNYLPAMLLFWPLALAVTGVGRRLEPTGVARSRTTDLSYGLLSAALLLGLASMTWANASIWGDTTEQALVWARMNPDSPRAQTNAATLEMAAGHPDSAIARLTPMLDRDPTQIQVALNLLAARCLQGSVDPATLEAAGHAMETSRDPGALLVSWSDRAIDTARAGTCKDFGLDALEHLIERGLKNSRFSNGRRQDIEHIRGDVALQRRDPATALDYFNMALDEQPRIEIAMQQSAMLGEAGFPREGLSHLDHFNALKKESLAVAPGMPHIHQWVLARQGYWDQEYRRLRKNLQDDVKLEDTHRGLR